MRQSTLTRQLERHDPVETLIESIEADRFATIKSYWRNPELFDRERAIEQAKMNALIDAAVRKNHPHIDRSSK